MNAAPAVRAIPSSAPLAGLRVMAVSPVSGYAGFNTSIHRVRALKSLGCQVDVLDSLPSCTSRQAALGQRILNRLFRYGLPVPLLDSASVGPRLLTAVSHETYDIIWLEKVLTLNREVLAGVRHCSPATLIVGFSPDDMAGRHNQSQQFLDTLPLHDLYLTTKTYNVNELQELGCPEVVFIGNGYDPASFRPFPVTPRDECLLGGDIGFIGTYESDRAEMLHFLATNGLHVRVWGDGWVHMKRSHPNLCIEGYPVYGDDFAKACSAFKINLGFLRKLNRDLQTTRSVEIPACGGFMLAERTSEHQELFVEGEEAEFFDSPEELLEKCHFYLAHEEVRRRIAERGYQRCLSSDYSNAGRLATVFPHLLFRLHQKLQRNQLS